MTSLLAPSPRSAVHLGLGYQWLGDMDVGYPCLSLIYPGSRLYQQRCYNLLGRNSSTQLLSTPVVLAHSRFPLPPAPLTCMRAHHPLVLMKPIVLLLFPHQKNPMFPVCFKLHLSTRCPTFPQVPTSALAPSITHEPAVLCLCMVPDSRAALVCLRPSLCLAMSCTGSQQ